MTVRMKPVDVALVGGGLTAIWHQGVASPVLHVDVTSLYPSLMIAGRVAPASDALGVFLELLTHLRDVRVDAVLRLNDRRGGRIEFRRYEDLCREPDESLRRLARFCELEEGVEALLARKPEVSPRKQDCALLSAEQRARIWAATEETAGSLGYLSAGTAT